MPAIGNVYFNHPVTAEEGLWLELTTGPGLVGLNDTQIQTLVPGGNPATKLARFQTALNTAIQALCEVKIPDSEITLDDPVRVTPEIGCRWEGGYYIQRIVEIDIPVISLGPPIVFGAITVSEAASRSTYW